MDSIDKSVVEFLVREFFGHGLRHLAWAVFLAFTMIFFGWRWRQMRSDIDTLKKCQTDAAPTQIILKPGATYNDFRGNNGELHVHVDGKAEIIAPKTVPIRIGMKGAVEGKMNVRLEHRKGNDR